MGRKHDIKGGVASVWKPKLKNYRYELIEEAIDKLGQFEDIEEELGIDLVTLLKALKDGFYYKKQGIFHTSDKENYIFLSAKSDLPNQMCIEVYFGDLEMMCFYFNEYGKTWALTQEELETQEEN